MAAEGWTGAEEHFGGRSYNNSNFRPRREGYQGGRQSYGQQGGYGQRSYGQNGGGRPNYGDRPQRQNYGGAPRQNGTYINYAAYGDGGSSSLMEIDSTKVGMVIGRGGGKIREIQENFHVHVKIDREAGQNGLTGVTIRGQDAAIEQAKHFIQDLIAVK